MFFAPADQLNGMETSGTAAAGSTVVIDTSGIREEISVDTHGSLYGARVVDFSHYISLVADGVCWAHGVEIITADTRRW